MIPKKHFEALRIIYERLSESNVNWAIAGSLNLLLHGLSVEVHDIDIKTDEEGAYRIEQLFSELIKSKVSFSSTGKIRSHFGVLMISGVEVEIMGDVQICSGKGKWEDLTDFTPHIDTIEIDGMKIPVLSLEYEYRAYCGLGRTGKAKLIKDWLETSLSNKV